MAVKSKKTAAPAAAPAPRAYLLEQEPKQLHVDFAKYMSDEVGVEWPTGDPAKDAQIAVVLRGPFQASEINQQRLQEAVAERENAVAARAAKAAEREAAAKAKEEAKAAKAAAPKAEKAAKAAPAPVKSAAKGKLKPVPTPPKAAPKKAPVRKGAASEAQF